MIQKVFKNKKFLTFAAVILLLSIILPLSAYIYKNNPKFQNLQEVKTNIEANDIKTPEQIHTKEFFYATLSLNPETNVITQIKTGTTTGGDIIPPFKKSPTASSDYLVYKVEVTSKDNVILTSGWEVVNKNILQKYQDSPVFTIKTTYSPEAIVRLYLPKDKLIWTGVMR